MAADTKDKEKDVKESRPRVSPVEFVRQVRQETSKVTWPARREWMVTTMMVFIMVALATVFFFGVDTIIAFTVRQLLTV
jgi:preprotein translocase subunit SecE